MASAGRRRVREKMGKCAKCSLPLDNRAEENGRLANGDSKSFLVVLALVAMFTTWAFSANIAAAPSTATLSFRMSWLLEKKSSSWPPSTSNSSTCCSWTMDPSCSIIISSSSLSRISSNSSRASRSTFAGHIWRTLFPISTSKVPTTSQNTAE